jgi:hypothetical protein
VASESWERLNGTETTTKIDLRQEEPSDENYENLRSSAKDEQHSGGSEKRIRKAKTKSGSCKPKSSTIKINSIYETKQIEILHCKSQQILATTDITVLPPLFN